MIKDELLFLSHNIRHQRSGYLLNVLRGRYNVVLPRAAVKLSGRLSIGSKSASNMFNLGLSALRTRAPTHLDGIDVFIQPFLRGKEILHDYHVPLVPEMKWLGLNSLAMIAHALLPDSLRKAKVVIAPNKQMLGHASEYARLDDYFIIPNYPPKKFHIDIKQEQARTELGLPKEKQIVLFIGGARLREIYGINLLFHSWQIVFSKKPDSKLYVIGPTQQLGFDYKIIETLRRKGIELRGSIEHRDVPKWIAAADLCVSQRTPGFPIKWYNIHDSLKLSEYALFKKPIATAGYLPGDDYISAETNRESYSKAIISGLRGEAPEPTPHTWEENRSTIRKAYSALMNG